MPILSQWHSYTVSQKHHDTTRHCGIPTASKPRQDSKHRANLKLLLQCSRTETLHNCLCRLRSDLHLLAEYIPHSCFRGWFYSGLDAAQAMDREDSCLLHLLRGNRCKAVQHVRTCLLLQSMLSGKCFGQGSLRHCLLRSSLHGFHWWQHGSETKRLRITISTTRVL